MRTLLPLSFALFLALTLVAPAAAQPACSPDWIQGFGPSPGVDGPIHALAEFDDGSGPAIYVAGTFRWTGGARSTNLARWDGATWTALGVGSFNAADALAVFDDGSGAALYAAGNFGGHALAKWNGVTWSLLGQHPPSPQSTRSALAVLDDGSGAALYVAGNFSSIAGIPAAGLARYDGSTWSGFGSGVSRVEAMAIYDDGNGPALYVGGEFSSAGGVIARGIAKWNGSAWEAVGGGVSANGFPGIVSALLVHDDGSGPALIAGGRFDTAGVSAARNLARWDGQGWSEYGGGVGTGFQHRVRSLARFDDGGGAALYVGGEFATANGIVAQGIARWDGQNWSELANVSASVGAMTVSTGQGGSTRLVVAGVGRLADGLLPGGIAAWDGVDWSALGEGVSDQGAGAGIGVTIESDVGGGRALYIGGGFSGIGGVGARNVARWDGTQWSPLGAGVGSANQSVRVMVEFDDGSGPALYAGGDFTSAGGAPIAAIAKWDGANWLALGSGLSPTPTVHDMLVFDSGNGPELWVCGVFRTAGGIPATNVAVWDGSSWSARGVGIGGFSSGVAALAVFDAGDGPKVYAAASNWLCRWEGEDWQTPIAIVSSGGIWTLETLDDGAGPALYAGGYFGDLAGTNSPNLAKWDGTVWSGFGNDTVLVHAIAMFDDGSGAGPALIVGGQLPTPTGGQPNRLAKWTGTDWSPLGEFSGGGSAIGLVRSLFASEDDGDAELWVGGDFAVSTSGDSHLARYGACPAKSFVVIPGCSGGDSVLSALSPSLRIGHALDLRLRTNAVGGTGYLLVGLDGSAPSGCGLTVPGLDGEFLLALSPGPAHISTSPIVGAIADFSLPVPNLATLVGQTYSFQTLHTGAAPGVIGEFANGLSATFVD